MAFNDNENNHHILINKNQIIFVRTERWKNDFPDNFWLKKKRIYSETRSNLSFISCDDCEAEDVCWTLARHHQIGLQPTRIDPRNQLRTNIRCRCLDHNRHIKSCSRILLVVVMSLFSYSIWVNVGFRSTATSDAHQWQIHEKVAKLLPEHRHRAFHESKFSTESLH